MTSMVIDTMDLSNKEIYDKTYCTYRNLYESLKNMMIRQ